MECLECKMEMKEIASAPYADLSSEALYECEACGVEAVRLVATDGSVKYVWE